MSTIAGCSLTPISRSLASRSLTPTCSLSIEWVRSRYRAGDPQLTIDKPPIHAILRLTERITIMPRPTFCNPSCKDSFQTGRRYGLIYGPAQLPNGKLAMRWENFAAAWGCCPYCMEITRPRIHDQATIIRRLFEVTH
jgi:hypothetical protein